MILKNNFVSRNCFIKSRLFLNSNNYICFLLRLMSTNNSSRMRLKFHVVNKNSFSSETVAIFTSMLFRIFMSKQKLEIFCFPHSIYGLINPRCFSLLVFFSCEDQREFYPSAAMRSIDTIPGLLYFAAAFLGFKRAIECLQSADRSPLAV